MQVKKTYAPDDRKMRPRFSYKKPEKRLNFWRLASDREVGSGRVPVDGLRVFLLFFVCASAGALESGLAVAGLPSLLERMSLDSSFYFWVVNLFAGLQLLALYFWSRADRWISPYKTLVLNLGGFALVQVLLSIAISSPVGLLFWVLRAAFPAVKVSACTLLMARVDPRSAGLYSRYADSGYYLGAVALVPILGGRLADSSHEYPFVAGAIVSIVLLIGVICSRKLIEPPKSPAEPASSQAIDHTRPNGRSAWVASTAYLFGSISIAFLTLSFPIAAKTQWSWNASMIGLAYSSRGWSLIAMQFIAMPYLLRFISRRGTSPLYLVAMAGIFIIGSFTVLAWGGASLAMVSCMLCGLGQGMVFPSLIQYISDRRGSPPGSADFASIKAGALVGKSATPLITLLFTSLSLKTFYLIAALSVVLVKSAVFAWAWREEKLSK